MDLDRIHSILNNEKKFEVYYDERPVWIQGVNNQFAKVGFIDNFEEKDVYIEDLYEKDRSHLYGYDFLLRKMYLE